MRQKVYWKPYLYVVLIALFAEAFLFNYRYYDARLAPDELTAAQYGTIRGLEQIGENEYLVAEEANAGIALEGFFSDVRYLYADIACYDADGEVVPTNLYISARDEGNDGYVFLGDASSYPSVERSKYVKLHTYGKAYGVDVGIYAQGVRRVTIGDVVLNARVPFAFQWKRFLLVAFALAFLWTFRARAPFYKEPMAERDRSQFIRTALTVVILVAVVLLLARVNRTDRNWWTNYNHLAVSLAEGRVTVYEPADETMTSLSNPYDYGLRVSSGANFHWDYAYYEGNYYVYFGVVPCLLFFLPYYLLTGQPFHAFRALQFCVCVCVVMTFLLLRNIVRRWFPKATFGQYLLMGIVAASTYGFVDFLLQPPVVMYYLPIVVSVALNLTGLTLWTDAANRLLEEKAIGCALARISAPVALEIAFGALCMALVAGCRPQLIAGAFLCFPIFGGIFRESLAISRRRTAAYAALFILPFVLVAAGLMYYNFIRFGSVFDFGSRYNLTTDDLTHRGVNVGRLVDGFFAYLFQPLNFGLRFPFVNEAPFHTTYVGRTITERLAGGVLFLKPFTWIAFAVVWARKELRQKRIRAMVVLPFLFTILILAADTELAGIVYRYIVDVLWLVVIAGCVICLQLWETFDGDARARRLTAFVLWTGVAGFLIEFFMSMRFVYLDDAGRYFYVMSFFR